MRAATCSGDSIIIDADVEDADLHLLVLRQVLQELDAGHVAVGVVEDELVDARRVEEVRQHRLVALAGSCALRMSLPHALPKQKCQPIFASTPSQHLPITSLIHS